MVFNEEPDNRDIPPEKDRRDPVPVEISINYMQSDAYKQTYGIDPVWLRYRRNFKGKILPLKNVTKCIKDGVIIRSNPCPICRDEYLVPDYRNIELLKQFVCPYTGRIYTPREVQVCTDKYRIVQSEILKARDYGYLTYDVPFREFDYNQYFDFDKWQTRKMC